MDEERGNRTRTMDAKEFNDSGATQNRPCHMPRIIGVDLSESFFAIRQPRV
jgi:hypothetical protein